MRNNLKLNIICLFVVLALSAAFFPSQSTAFTGKVIGISDGDTITVLRDGDPQVKIRLYGIDCPENAQPFSKEAKKFTSSKVYGKHVTVRQYDMDRYGRVVAVVMAKGQNLNQDLVGEGYAWVSTKYCKSNFCNDWLRRESQARAMNIGLWNDNKPIPPWEWRSSKQRVSREISN